MIRYVRLHPIFSWTFSRRRLPWQPAVRPPLSLRTFQSSLFDLSSAIREAYRVIRNNGFIIISIANGFVDEINGEKKVIRGLLIPSSKIIVDKNTPLRIALTVHEKLHNLGFESIGILSNKTDIYVWCKKP